MKTEEDEAFDELARRQGDWGSGFQAKRKMAADKDALFEKFEVEQPAQEHVARTDLLKEAQQIVESKFLWKKFIDGTPLANDIAFWMADFVQQYTTPPKREWVGLTDEELADCLDMSIQKTCRAIEAKLKEKNNGT
jgi:hypothetical protein